MRKQKSEHPATLRDLLAVYHTRLQAPQRTVVRAFCSVVARTCAYPLSESQVSYTPATKTLFIITTGPLKQELLLREEALLRALSATLGKHNTPRRIL